MLGQLHYIIQQSHHVCTASAVPTPFMRPGFCIAVLPYVNWSGQLVSLCNVSRCNCTYVLKTLSAKSNMQAVTLAMYAAAINHTAPASPGVCALSYWGSSSRCRHRSPAQGGLGRRSRTRSFWEGPPAHCPWCLVFPTPGEACSSTHSGDPCTDLVGEEGWGRWRYEEDGWGRRDGPWVRKME